MINSFKEQLKHMALDPEDRFRFHLRKRVGKRATILLEKKLKQSILLMPGILSRIYELWAQARTPMKAKSLSGFLLTYMYHPNDFFPEKSLGFFGYLDDAYCVITVFEKAVDEFIENGLGLEARDEKLIKEIRGLKRAIRIVIPAESACIDRMLSELESGSQETFLKMFQMSHAA